LTPTYQRLSAQDSSFVMFEGPGTHMHVASVGLFETGPLRAPEGGLDVERLRRYVDARLDAFPRYRQKLTFTPLQGHPVWVDDDRFNLHYHVRHTALPAPGSDDQLKDLVGRILSQQLDRAKPLWEMWFVEGLEHDRFAMLTKVHHCMVDGASGVDLLTGLLDTGAEPSFASTSRWRPQASPGRLELLVDEVGRRLAAPLSLARTARSAVRRPQAASDLLRGADAVWQALAAGFRVPPATPLNGPIGTHRRVDWRTLPLAEVKEVKKRLDGTVNDVVLAVVTGALRRFFRRRRTPLRDFDFRVVIPVNMRSGPAEDHAGNHVSALFLSLPLAEADPVRRFRSIRDETLRLKRSRAAEGFDLLARFADWTGSDQVTYWGTRLASTVRPYNMIVTNVPGPQFPLYLLGARQQAIHPFLPLFVNQGAGIAVMSYLGRVCFGLIGDWDLAPDLPALGSAIDDAFAELREAAVAGRVDPRTPKPRRAS
jgi:diacylglycerol O-acyltransferase